MDSKASAIARTLTSEQGQGPFYPVVKPSDQDADLTVIKGKRGKAQGQVIYVMGKVSNLKGEPLPGIQIEIWQANTFGRYTHPDDKNTAPFDPNFQGYGTQVTDEKGRYRFKTVKPHAYPASSDWTRPPHIHFIFTGKSNRLITQLYFEGEPLNAVDHLFKNAPNKQGLLTKLMPPATDMEPEALIAPWDVVLR